MRAPEGYQNGFGVEGFRGSGFRGIEFRLYGMNVGRILSEFRGWFFLKGVVLGVRLLGFTISVFCLKVWVLRGLDLVVRILGVGCKP